MPVSVDIPIVRKDGTDTGLKMRLVCPSVSDHVLIAKDEADKFFEARDQILEGVEYAYAFHDGSLSFAKHSVVSPSMTHSNEGRIRTGNYVGRLLLDVVRADVKVGQVDLQVRSKKIGFRDQYHKMLEDIAREAAELVMSSSEATYQKYEVDPSQDKRTRYEQFAFVRSLLQSDAFVSAMGRICNSPITAMKDVIEERRTNSIRRMGRDVVRQLASASNRDPLPVNHPLYEQMPSLPRYVVVHSREETVDVPENRFVKYVLKTFLNFVEDVGKLAKEDSRLAGNARAVADELGNFLLDPMFGDVSELDRVSFSSPALQRREGYREILRVWLMFGMAAKIGWKGGEDVYGAGNRNIAVLYEYWAFFELLKIVSAVFGIERKQRECLLVKENNGLELALRRGKAVMLSGVYEPEGCKRPLEVRFHYNKTFAAEDDFDKAGSWTVDMRPDYTISLWPKGFTETAAEQADAIVHVHFDAKYRIDKFKDVFEKEPNTVSHSGHEDDQSVQEVLNTFHAEEDEGNYQRGDLLKMHSYNDSIRRTYGSYILYPGQGEDEIHRYREIIPGIGAFVMRPQVGSNESIGSVTLKLFLQKIALSLQNRLTQHERMAKYHNFVHRDEPLQMPIMAMKLKLPEWNVPMARPFIPAEEYVIVGYYKSDDHLNWVLDNFYNFRLGDARGSLHVNPGVLAAEYLLLHGPGEAAHTNRLFKIDYEHSRMVWSKKDLVDAGYPGTPSGDYYLMFKLTPILVGEPLYGGTYDIRDLNGYGGGRNSSKPFDTTFADFLQHGVASVLQQIH